VASNRLVPYPKRLKALIKSYQETNSPDDFKKILLLVDRLLIKIIHQIYKYESYSYLKKFEPNEIYHTGIVALGKAIKSFEIDDSFTIKKLSSRLNGYIGREFKMSFSASAFYIGFDEIGEGEEVKVQGVVTPPSIESIIDGIKIYNPKFPDRGIEAIKLHLSNDMSLQDIADHMNLKKGCIRSWVDRGKRILKRMIDKERKQDLWLS
jgi:hypothetical protein